MLFDISDLIYYLGHHTNLTGIQRVQSSIVISMIDEQVLAPSAAIFLSFNATTRSWVAIPTGFLISLLRDLFLPESQRLVHFSTEAARYGVLPGAQPFDGMGTLDDGNPSVLCLLGAAWVQPDYLHRVLSLKRSFGTRFVMMVHDLIPIYARETCDQDTARVFEDFMSRALRHVDHVLTVSEYTAKDARRYLATLRVPEPPITVTRNGSSFAQFLPKGARTGQVSLRGLPERFVLFVATIEGRKNHRLMLDVWRRMVEDGDNPPHLVCVGRLGWKASTFINPLVETDYLNGRIHLLRDISDSELCALYDRCLFTLCPTLYEGWGLPVGESLAMGKICVSSDRTSIPEVAGDCGVYLDIDNVERSVEMIRGLILDAKARAKLEAKIRRDYKPVTWSSVARRVVDACEGAVAVEWQEPYPYTALPYSTEISFGQLDREVNEIGEPLLARVVEARAAHFTQDLLNEQSFLIGEEIRSGGTWALPERWGTWLCQSGGDIIFSLAQEASQFYYLYLRIRVSNWLSEQTVRLLGNGEPLWEGRIGPQSKDIILRVRKRSDVEGAWPLCIDAQVSLTPELRDEIAAFDRRVPTIGFERLVVIPENDVKARMDVLTKTML
jgi:glycosyltransferase involved in cell wall biosynthesis